MDPYILSPEHVQSAPESLRERLKHLGPSLILSAAIVGSGELIATTSLGAKAGFTTFWLIILGCFIKVMVQLGFGKYTLLSGKTAMQSLNDLPGPRTKRANWVLWSMAPMMLLKLLQMGGIIGGVALILEQAFPGTPLYVWAVGSGLVVAFLVSNGYYRSIERISIYMIAFFTIFTFSALYFLKYTPYALTWSDIAEGLTFKLPQTSLAFAFGAFGITGVGGDEIIHYNYWCLEKGYAAFTGPKENSVIWENRAKGWLKVMQLDALIAMFIYTAVTAAFYLLGAAVLHSQGELPEGYEMIETLSQIFTTSLGPSARLFFLAGSFVVLFSTLFASLAAWTRQYTDILGQFRLIDFHNSVLRNKVNRWLSWILPAIWVLLFLLVKLPLAMVLIGGIVGSLILIIVVLAVIYFRYFGTEKAFRPTFLYDFIFWISCLSILAIALYGILRIFIE